MKKCLLFIIVLFFAACASKSEEQINAELQRQILMHTQKIKFKQNGEDSILVLSYLTPILDKENKDIFVLFVSPQDSKIEHLRVFMDINEARLTPLHSNDELKKYLINSDYTSYYKLSFPFKNAPVITLRLCLSLDCFELSFQKYSKSMYYRSTDVNTLYN